MRRLLALIACLLLWALLASPAGAEAEGVIEGRVINGSEGGGSVADLEVTLSTSAGTGQVLTARTNPLGQFRFTALATGGDQTYTVAVRYQGVDYTAAGIQLDPDNPSAQVDLYVYETTTSQEVVKVLLDHHIVTARPQKDRLEVVNYIKLANTGDRTVVADRDSPGPSFFFPLPEAAINLQWLEGSPAEALQQAIIPGEQEGLFAYELAYSGDDFVFRKSLPYPTEKAVFLMSAEEAQAASEQLPTKKEVESETGPYQVLSGEDLAAGTVLEVRLTGLPTSGGTSLGDLLRPAAIVLAIVAVGAIVAYARFRRRRASSGPAEG